MPESFAEQYLCRPSDPKSISIFPMFSGFLFRTTSQIFKYCFRVFNSDRVCQYRSHVHQLKPEITPTSVRLGFLCIFQPTSHARSDTKRTPTEAYNGIIMLTPTRA